MRARPLIMGIALISVGWATGGGAAQILFTLFGEVVFKKGAAGIGIVPFQAFGVPEDTGWCRLSAGAASPAEIKAALPRLADALAALR